MSKTYTGGYRLVSLAFIDLALASTAIAVAGLGDALGIKSRKRVVLTDIVVSGENKEDVTVQVKKDGDNYVIEDVYGYDLSIDASGNLTSSEHSSGGGTKLYRHVIVTGEDQFRIGSTNYTGTLTFISTKNEPISDEDTFEFVGNAKFKSSVEPYSEYIIICAVNVNVRYGSFGVGTIVDSSLGGITTAFVNSFVSDTVTEL